MMEQLTEKQIKARAYYAENAEKIKQQKRDEYRGGNKKIKPTSATKKPLNIKPISVKPKSDVKPKVVAYVDRKLSARERIENMKIDMMLSELNQ